MAPLPPILVRLAATFLTQALTRRLVNSPTFFRLVGRVLHEIDHLPHRLDSKPVPPYRHPDPKQPTLGEWAKDAFRNAANEDPGEPHDEPSPFGPVDAKAKEDAARQARRWADGGRRRGADDATTTTRGRGRGSDSPPR